MPSAEQELKRLQWLLHERKISPDESVKLIIPRLEAKKRVANNGPKVKTRLVRELDDPETYSAFNLQFDRYVELAGGNPSIAYGIILRCLEQLSDDMIRRLADA